MSIEFGDGCAVLQGSVGAEDAEVLAQWLQGRNLPNIDLGGCQHLHGAVLQVLLALRPKLAVPPPDPLLASILQTD